MDGAADEAAKLKEEWARAQGFGRVLRRRRAFATCMALLVCFGILVVGYGVLVLLLGRWIFGQVAAWSAALSVGWWVRTKLWPRGQFA